MLYASDAADWERVAARLRTKGAFGLDTEFSGVDLRSESCVRRARVHVWSVAVATGRLHPRGYPITAGVVLPADALSCPAIVGVLNDPKITKYVHNLPVDSHTLANHGIDLQGAVNTLSMARWMLPGIASYGLKDLMPLFGRRPLGDFKELFRKPKRIPKVNKIREKGCSCGEEGCRKRKGPHEKWEKVRHEIEWIEKGFEPIPLTEIVPGHDLWDTLLKYAGEDAMAALELACWLPTVNRSTPSPFFRAA